MATKPKPAKTAKAVKAERRREQEAAAYLWRCRQEGAATKKRPDGLIIVKVRDESSDYDLSGPYL